MRDDVCIILNEREPLKKQLANSLEEQLQFRKICCERLEPSASLGGILLERLPRVVVLDYVLGDVATALDILSVLAEPLGEGKTSAILWTDEPSVSVAVMAMKLGASDYIQSGIAASLERVIQAIETALARTESTKRRQKPQRASSLAQKPVSNSRSYQSCIQLALSAVNRGDQIIILNGGKGCGRNTLARYLHHERVGAGQLFELDLDVFSGNISDICGAPDKPYSAPLFSLGNTVFVDHAEFDDGEFVENITEVFSNSLEAQDNSAKSLLIIGTSDEKTAATWHRLLSCPVINIPGLSDRADDLWPLTQAFLGEIRPYATLNKLNFSPQVIHLLSNYTWPGNVRQLRAAIIEAATIPNPEVRDKADPVNHPELSRADTGALQVILEAKTRWEAENKPTPIPPPPLEIRAAVDKAGGNLRIAAARLQTGIPQIRCVLGLRNQGGSVAKHNGVKHNGAEQSGVEH